MRSCLWIAIGWLAVVGIAAGESVSLREQCDPGKLTLERFAEIRDEIRSSEPSAARLAKSLELWEAREALAWKRELLIEVARAHEACGRLEAFIGGLEERAAAKDPGAALLLAELGLAMYEAGDALRWAQLAVEQAPLDDAEFWRVAIAPLGAMRVLDSAFIERVMAQPELPGDLRFLFLLEVRGNPGFSQLAKRWLVQRPGEFRGAVPLLYSYVEDLPKRELRAAIDRSLPEKHPQLAVLLATMVADLALIENDIPAVLAGYWKAFGLAGKMDGTTRLNTPLRWSQPALAPGASALIWQSANDRQVVGLHAKHGDSVRSLRLSCLSKICRYDGDGSSTATTLAADAGFAKASRSTRMACLMAAGLHHQMAEELEACARAKNDPVAEQLATLRYFSDEAKYYFSVFARRAVDISWQLRVLDASLEIARGICAEDPAQIEFLVSEIHDSIANYFGMRPHVRPALLGLVEAWQTDNADQLVVRAALRERLQVGIAPPGIPDLTAFLDREPEPRVASRIADARQRRDLERAISRQLSEFTGRSRSERGRSRASEFHRAGYGHWYYIGMQELELNVYSSLSLERRAQLSPIHQRRALIADALAAIRDLWGKVEGRAAALAQLRKVIGDDPQLAHHELVAAQWLALGSSPDWKNVEAIATRHLQSESVIERLIAKHLLSEVAWFDKRPADYKALRAEITAMFSLPIKNDLNETYGDQHGTMTWDEDDPVRVAEPEKWMAWARRNLISAKDQVAAARLMIKTFAPARRSDRYGRFYLSALEVLKKYRLLDGLEAELLEAAEGGDLAAASTLLAGAGGKHFELEPIVAAKMITATGEPHHMAHETVMMDAIKRGDDATALASWLVAASFDPRYTLRQALNAGGRKHSDTLLLGMCAGFPQLIEARRLAGPEYWATELVEPCTDLAVAVLARETTREAGLRLVKEMFPHGHRGRVPQLLVQELASRVDEAFFNEAVFEFLWPAGLAAIGLPVPGMPVTVQRGGAAGVINSAVFSSFTPQQLAPAFARANQRGELAALHKLAQRGIAAGIPNLDLLWFDFLASLEREPSRSPDALAGIYAFEVPVHPHSAQRRIKTPEQEQQDAARLASEDGQLLRLYLPLISDAKLRHSALIKVARARQPEISMELLTASFEAAKSVGDAASAEEFRDLAIEKTIADALGAQPALLMVSLIRSGEKAAAQRLFDALHARCLESPELIAGDAGMAVIAFLDQPDPPEKRRQPLAQLIAGAASRTDSHTYPQLFDLAVRKGLAKEALALVEGIPDTPASQKTMPGLLAIKQLAAGTIDSSYLHARILPDERGKAVVHWDVAARSPTGWEQGTVRHRYPIDQFEIGGELTITVVPRSGIEKVTVTVPANPRGRQAIDILASDCVGVGVQLGMNRDPEVIKKGGCLVNVVGENLLSEKLENDAEAAAAWDPCYQTISFSHGEIVEKSATNQIFYRLGSPIPMDQTVAICFHSWLRIDGSACLAAEPSRGQCEFGFLLLDENQQVLTEPNFEQIHSAPVSVGGAWSFLSNRTLPCTMRTRHPRVSWLQPVIALKLSGKHRSLVRLTLGDPCLSTGQRGDYVGRFPLVEHQLQAGARPLATQVIRDSRAHDFGIPAVCGNQLQRYSKGQLVSAIELDSVPKHAFMLSSDRSLIALCEDRRIWKWKELQLESLGDLPAPSADGDSVLVASPEGRRLVRIIVSAERFTLEVFMVARDAITRQFVKHLGPDDLARAPRYVGFDGTGKFYLEGVQEWIELSLLDQSHRKPPVNPAPTLSWTRLSWKDDACISGIRTPGALVNFGGSKEVAISGRINSGDLAFIEPDSNRVTTIENGWFRHWNATPPIQK